MIYNLRKKFIKVTAISVAVVSTIIFFIIYGVSWYQLNKSMDLLTDGIPVTSSKLHATQNEKKLSDKKDANVPDKGNAEENVNDGTGSGVDNGTAQGANDNHGNIPETAISSSGDRPLLKFEANPDLHFITEETPYSTRFFIVYFDAQKNITYLNVDYVKSVTSYDASGYSLEALEEGSERGWIDGYRYKVSDTENGFAIAFVDGNMNISILRMVTITAAIVLACSTLIIVGILILYSKRAVKPVAESYEKQKQFITDVNHELKTPLTLILTNVDIAEQQAGKNEWLDDIRTEGQRMNSLVNQLVTLSRMDEDNSNIEMEDFNISNAVSDTVSEFSVRVQKEGKSINADVENAVYYKGDEALIRRLVAILLDNAVKYCDTDGAIDVKLTNKRHIMLTVENKYKEVNNVELDKLFDRFYRSDKVRTYSGSYGVGLSIAKAIAAKHNGDITAYKKDDSTIGFKVILKR